MRSIQVRDLSKRYGQRLALDAVSFDVTSGSVVALVGPNGAGKSTALNLICGLLIPDAGTVLVQGHDVGREPAAVRAGLGIVFQETVLYEALTARENLVFHGRLQAVPRRELPGRVSAVLELVQLSERATSRVATFSGGMKRRLALARALLHEPAVVLLDEPTLGIDVQARNAIWERTRALRDEGRAVLVSTNYMDEAEALADRLVVLDEGRLLAEATPQQLRQQTDTATLNDAFLALTGRELRD